MSDRKQFESLHLLSETEYGSLTTGYRTLDKAYHLLESQLKAEREKHKQDIAEIKGVIETDIITPYIALLKVIDKLVKDGNLDARSAIGDARLNCGEPFKYDFLDKINKLEEK